MTNAIIELGWKRVLMVSKNIGKDEEAMTLARNGIHVASTSNPCEMGHVHKQYLDGFILRIKEFDKPLFQKTYVSYHRVCPGVPP